MQTLEEQLSIVERALGERMIIRGLAVVYAWMTEMGENSYFEKKYRDITTRYQNLFTHWLTSNDPEIDKDLYGLTNEAYDFADQVYVELRLHRGLSPRMYGFNEENPQSVLQYFSSCVEISLSDLEWLEKTIDDPEKTTTALLAVAALSKNIRECFSAVSISTLLTGSISKNEMVAMQCLANLIFIFIHYDLRIDFYQSLQETFLHTIGDGQNAFEVLVGLIRASDVLNAYAHGEAAMKHLPEEAQNLLTDMGLVEASGKEIKDLLPQAEKDYMNELLEALPETWIYSALVGDNDERRRALGIAYLSLGRMDLMWDDTETAERWLREALRRYSRDQRNNLNYAHCLMLRGDRMMAFEYYRKARVECGNAKNFYTIFRPDRRRLIDRGVPLEQVYLIEDQLLSV